MQHRPSHGGTTAILLAGAVLAGCGTLQAHEGARLPAAERAVVRADRVFSAGLPVEVILRKAGEWVVPARHAAVELAPGHAVLLVDCRVAATGTTARFAVEAELEAGRSYRLEADATAQRCEGVRLVPR